MREEASLIMGFTHLSNYACSAMVIMLCNANICQMNLTLVLNG